MSRVLFYPGKEFFLPSVGHHFGTGYSANHRPVLYYSSSLDRYDNPQFGYGQDCVCVCVQNCAYTPNPFCTSLNHFRHIHFSPFSSLLVSHCWTVLSLNRSVITSVWLCLTGRRLWPARGPDAERVDICSSSLSQDP